MKVINLQIENFKRLKAVEITPDGYLQVIGGDNAQGKTSVMDALWATLAGGTSTRSITNPIREGEDQASVRLDMGEIIVTRTWKNGKSALKVESQLGAIFPSPQKMLDAMIGRLSFDPLEFTRLDNKAQTNALLDITGLGSELDRLANIREVKYAERTEIGRNVKRYQGEVDAIPNSTPLFNERINVREAVDKLQLANEYNRLRSALLDERDKLAKDYADFTARIVANDEAIEKHIADIDIAPMQEQIDMAESVNAGIEQQEKRETLQAELNRWESLYAARESDIQEIDEEKDRLLESAAFPIEGLAFDDEGITYNGIPFGQASSAEQIRVSLGMAMALNPQIKVIRIMDGSLLDFNSMQIVYDMAHEKDYQVWVERVGSGDAMAVIIEDGEVKE